MNKSLFGIDGLSVDDSHYLVYQNIRIITIEELHDYCEQTNTMPGDTLRRLCHTTALRDRKIEAITA